ncbi:hypothetical protein [Bacillus altitudinis]
MKVVEWLMKGEWRKEIGSTLFISCDTVHDDVKGM